MAAHFHQSLIIRLATKDEADIIADIIRKSFARQVEMLEVAQEAYPNYVGFETSERVQARIGRGSQVMLVFLAGKAVGTVSYGLDAAKADCGYIERMAVLPDYRGRGFGNVILEYAELMLRDLGVNCIRLTIVAQFSALQRFYERAGYRVTGRAMPTGLPFGIFFMEKCLT